MPPDLHRCCKGSGRVCLYALTFLSSLLLSGWSWGLPKNSSKEAPPEHANRELTADDFQEFMATHPVRAVLFYAPWCFYSQQIMHPWDVAAQKLMLHDPPVVLARIDANRYRAIGENYGVKAFPTMKLFVDDVMFDNDRGGNRNWQGIVKWVNGHLDREHVLMNTTDADHFLHDNSLNVVGLFADNTSSNVFSNVSRHFDDVIFAEVKNASVVKDVAAHVAAHADMMCETIEVGRSRTHEKKVDLPREGMHCDDKPRNPQKADWIDKYSVDIQGKTLTVRRTDSTAGWQQQLQFKCCDSASKKTTLSISIPSVVMSMPHDERFAVYDGDIHDSVALNRWIEIRRFPLLMRFDEERADSLMSGKGNTFGIFFISPVGNPAFEEEMRKASRAVRGTCQFYTSGRTTPIERRLAQIAGIEDDEQDPVITLIETRMKPGKTGEEKKQPHGLHKFRLPFEGAKSENIVQFLHNFEQGKLKYWLRSEPEPDAADQKGNVVGVLVGTTFSDVAHDPNFDVLVDMFAPWCGHCHRFEPHYKKLAQKLRHVKTLKITKIDATRNDIEGLTIQAYPTILLFKAGGTPKSIVEFGGRHEEEDLVRWLQRHCTHSFDPEAPPAPVVENQPVSGSEVGGLLDPAEEDL